MHIGFSQQPPKQRQCEPVYKRASNACGYPLDHKRLLRAAPQAPLNAEVPSAAARSCERFDTIDQDSSPLFLVFFLFGVVFRLHVQEPVNVGLCRQQLPHFFLGTPVLRIGAFLLSQELSVFRLQFFDGGQLFDAQFVEGFLCGLRKSSCSK